MIEAVAEPAGWVPPKRYRVGEIVQFTGLSRQTIHNYTAMGLIREVERTMGGHRLYDEAVFPRLRQIIQMKAEKSMTEIRREFEGQEV